MSSQLIDVTDDNFSTQVLDSDKPVLVDFWAPWCGPCKAMAPVMKTIAASYADDIQVAKCNVDSSPQTSAQYGIQSIPTLIVFKGGQPIEKIVGLVPSSRIEAAIDKALSGAAAGVSLTTV